MLVLLAHALFLLLLWVERIVPARALPPDPQWHSIAIQLLPPPSDPPDPATRLAPSSTTTARATVRAIAPAPPPPDPLEALPDSGEEAPPTDWHAEAAARAARYAEQVENPRPLRVAEGNIARQPCRPRQDFDAATRRQMAERLPPKPDLPLTGAAPATPSVNMGGVRVGVVPLFSGARPPREEDGGRKSSFRWRWDDTSRGGIAVLTPGWEEAPPYDGMFDDMQAGRTPQSSVPDPHDCD